VTRRIREREQGRREHIPIIAMTAYAMEEDHGRCLEAGMDDYVSKPIRFEELYQMIERLLSAAAAV
jgi:two-component system sensor histidine kinase/response regulator